MAGSICDRLKEARQKKGKEYTQSKVAEKVGLANPQTLSYYENGKRELNIETLKKLARLYDVSTDWLLFGDKMPKAEIEERDRIYYVRSLIEAVNALNIQITAEQTDDYGNECYLDRLMLTIDNKQHRDFYQTVDEIRRLQEVKNLLDPDDFNALIERRIKYYEEHHAILEEDDDLPF